MSVYMSSKINVDIIENAKDYQQDGCEDVVKSMI